LESSRKHKPLCLFSQTIKKLETSIYPIKFKNKKNETAEAQFKSFIL
jgi:hypothetical protein